MDGFQTTDTLGCGGCAGVHTVVSSSSKGSGRKETGGGKKRERRRRKAQMLNYGCGEGEREEFLCRLYSPDRRAWIIFCMDQMAQSTEGLGRCSEQSRGYLSRLGWDVMAGGGGSYVIWEAAQHRSMLQIARGATHQVKQFLSVARVLQTCRRTESVSVCLISLYSDCC